MCDNMRLQLEKKNVFWKDNVSRKCFYSSAYLCRPRLGTWVGDEQFWFLSGASWIHLTFIWKRENASDLRVVDESGSRGLQQRCDEKTFQKLPSFGTQPPVPVPRKIRNKICDSARVRLHCSTGAEDTRYNGNESTKTFTYFPFKNIISLEWLIFRVSSLTG